MTVLLCFFWLNVMCYDIWSTFKGGHLRERGCSAELKRFGLYCAYAFGLPAILTLILFAIDAIELIPAEYKPGIGLDSCFMKSKSNLQFFYVYMPISLILIVS